MSVLPGLQQNQTKAFCGVPKFIFWKLDLCKAKIHLTNTMGKLIKLQNCIVCSIAEKIVKVQLMTFLNCMHKMSLIHGRYQCNKNHLSLRQVQTL